MPDAEYRALPGLSGTGIVKLLNSPAIYRDSVDEPSEPGEAQRRGTVIHAAVLGSDMPTEFTDRWATLSGEASKKWARDCDERGVLPALSVWPVEAMVAALAASAEASEVLAEGHSELTVTWEREGVPMKGRIDRLTNRVVDLKTISTRGDDMLTACNKAIGSYGTHAQLMHYSSGVDAVTGAVAALAPVLVYVESEFPHRVAVIELSETDMAQGYEMCLEAYRRYADCTEADNWPAMSPEGVTTSHIPAWAARSWDRALGKI